MRHGMTLIELALTIVIAAAIAATAIPGFRAVRDRLAVHGATSALTSALADTRHAARRWSRRTALTADTAAALIVVRAGIDTVARHPLGALYGVRLRVTRDSVAYQPTGAGYGASNATFILSRGTAAETVTVSRLGRVRR